MSKLSELIKELCPNGVEYKKLGDIATISRGGSFQKKDFVEDGFPCIHYGQIYTRYSLFPTETLTFINPEIAHKQKKAQPNDIVMAVTSENVEDVCKCVAWLGNQEIAVSGHTAIIHHEQDPKFLTYYFYTKEFFEQKKKLAHGTKVIEVTPDKLLSIVLPVPPLQVQREIVHILDNFTKLTAELTAELTARKRQYEFYRNKILTFEEKMVFKKLGITCDMKAGKAISSYLISEFNDNEHKYKCYGGNGNRGYVKEFSHEGEYPIIGRQGALCGNINYAKGKFYATEHAVVVKSLGEYTQRFLYHMLTHMNLNQYKSSGAQPGLSVKNILDIKAPVPPLPVQEHIVRVLDNFEAICNDLQIGLPAEIEARKKQYEYYRDLLLTFVETGAIPVQTDRQTDRQQ